MGPATRPGHARLVTGVLSARVTLGGLHNSATFCRASCGEHPLMINKLRIPRASIASAGGIRATRASNMGSTVDATSMPSLDASARPGTVAASTIPPSGRPEGSSSGPLSALAAGPGSPVPGSPAAPNPEELDEPAASSGPRDPGGPAPGGPAPLSPCPSSARGRALGSPRETIRDAQRASTAAARGSPASRRCASMRCRHASWCRRPRQGRPARMCMHREQPAVYP